MRCAAPVPDAAVGQPAVNLVLTDGSVNDDVRTFLVFLSAREFSPNTIRAYAYDLLKLMTFLESRGWSVQDFTAARAVEFLQWLRQQTSRRRGQRYEVAAVTASGGVPLSARTCNRVMACVSSSYEYLITAECYRDRENPIVKQGGCRLRAGARSVPAAIGDQRGSETDPTGAKGTDHRAVAAPDS